MLNIHILYIENYFNLFDRENALNRKIRKYFFGPKIFPLVILKYI